AYSEMAAGARILPSTDTLLRSTVTVAGTCVLTSMAPPMTSPPFTLTRSNVMVWPPEPVVARYDSRPSIWRFDTVTVTGFVPGCTAMDPTTWPWKPGAEVSVKLDVRVTDVWPEAGIFAFVSISTFPPARATSTQSWSESALVHPGVELGYRKSKPPTAL